MKPSFLLILIVTAVSASRFISLSRIGHMRGFVVSLALLESSPTSAYVVKPLQQGRRNVRRHDELAAKIGRTRTATNSTINDSGNLNSTLIATSDRNGTTSAVDNNRNGQRTATKKTGKNKGKGKGRGKGKNEASGQNRSKDGEANNGTDESQGTRSNDTAITKVD